MVICARGRSPTGLPGTLEETAEAIREDGGEVLAVGCDVTVESEVNEMVREATERYGRIDVLCQQRGSHGAGGVDPGN